MYVGQIQPRSRRPDITPIRQVSIHKHAGKRILKARTPGSVVMILRKEIDGSSCASVELSYDEAKELAGVLVHAVKAR